ncbi:MAG: ACP S-malonyltransferase [Sphingomonadales bacterium]
MTRAFVFPGQGSQFVGMGKDLFDAEAKARLVFEEVDDALDAHLSKIIFDGPEDDLRLTENTQPALMAVSMAVVRVLEDRIGPLKDNCSYVAGHSLGEYSALAAAGSLSIADTARLLRLRGQAMQRAVPVGEGAMAALLGLDFADAQEIAEAAAQGGRVCTSANDNAPGQVVVSGHKDAVEKATELAKEKGAKRAVLLPVSAPFHCPLMQPAADEMRDALADATISAPVVPLIANVTADKVEDPDQIRDLLVNQVTGSVRWRESVMRLAEFGVTDLVELGAGKVLSGLTRRIDRSLSGSAIGDMASIDSFAESIS